MLVVTQSLHTLSNLFVESETGSNICIGSGWATAVDRAGYRYCEYHAVNIVALIPGCNERIWLAALANLLASIWLTFGRSELPDSLSAFDQGRQSKTSKSDERSVTNMQINTHFAA
jgi:hypothetical protein